MFGSLLREAPAGRRPYDRLWSVLFALEVILSAASVLYIFSGDRLDFLIGSGLIAVITHRLRVRRFGIRYPLRKRAT